jgi:hypothetical protein
VSGQKPLVIGPSLDESPMWFMAFALGIWHNLRLGGATRACEEYRMERLGRGLFSCSKLRDGSPSLSRLRIATVGPEEQVSIMY